MSIECQTLKWLLSHQVIKIFVSIIEIPMFRARVRIEWLRHVFHEVDLSFRLETGQSPNILHSDPTYPPKIHTKWLIFCLP